MLSGGGDSNCADALAAIDQTAKIVIRREKARRHGVIGRSGSNADAIAARRGNPNSVSEFDGDDKSVRKHACVVLAHIRATRCSTSTHDRFCDLRDPKRVALP
jgi:hypothetical protein